MSYKPPEKREAIAKHAFGTHRRAIQLAVGDLAAGSTGCHSLRTPIPNLDSEISDGRQSEIPDSLIGLSRPWTAGRLFWQCASVNRPNGLDAETRPVGNFEAPCRKR